MLRVGFIFLFLLGLGASGLRAEAKYVNRLKSHEQFLDLAGKPLSEKYSGTKAVKVVLELRKQKLHFISSKHYKYHRDFCVKVLFNDVELNRFNFTNYRSGYLREYVFATINYYPDRKIYTLEFADIEKFSKDDILIYKLVKDKTFIGDKLRLHPITDDQVAFIKSQKEDLNTISSNELYQGLSKQMLVKGSVVGHLRKIDIDTLDRTKIYPWDIVLTNGSPNDIALCAGLIITRFQSPLSHINVLCHNRGTPVLAFKDAFVDESILSMVNKPIRFEIGEDYKITLAKQEELDRVIRRPRVIRVRDLKVDRTFKEMRDIEKLSFRAVNRVGGKAANLGELYKVRRLTKSCQLPEKGFAIPFVYYLQHFKNSGAEKQLRTLIADSLVLKNPIALKTALKKIRRAIKEYPIDKATKSRIIEKIQSNNYDDKERIRFRSSTNAEDIEGFNGAGLYNSCTGIMGATEGKTIDRAIKKVWASVWNEKAFTERNYFGINHQTVAMGILVHKTLGTEEVNGVVITKNLYRSGDEAYVINAQKGEVAIVAGSDSSTSELSVLSKSYYDGQVHNDYISYSILNGEKALMNKKQLENLYDALEKIKQHYYFRVKKGDVAYGDYALDVEFKIKNGEVIIKQVRPFK